MAVSATNSQGLLPSYLRISQSVPERGISLRLKYSNITPLASLPVTLWPLSLLCLVFIFITINFFCWYIIICLLFTSLQKKKGWWTLSVTSITVALKWLKFEGGKHSKRWIPNASLWHTEVFSILTVLVMVWPENHYEYHRRKDWLQGLDCTLLQKLVVYSMILSLHSLDQLSGKRAGTNDLKEPGRMNMEPQWKQREPSGTCVHSAWGPASTFRAQKIWLQFHFHLPNLTYISLVDNASPEPYREANSVKGVLA